MKDSVKDNFKIILWIVGITFIIFVGLGWFYVFYDRDCMESHANNYCIGVNLTLYDSFSNNFKCLEIQESRLSNYDLIHTFYYLEEEKAECLIKERGTFKRFDSLSVGDEE